MTKKSYSDKLKSPLWQKKRLEILNRDGFMCMDCGDAENMLSVHHKYYTKGAEPWEYPSECYITVCDDCHKRRHEYRPQCEQNLLAALREVGADYWELQLLSQALYNAKSFSNFYGNVRHLLSKADIFDHTCPLPMELNK